MSDNPLARHGGVSYLEIPTTDPKRSAAFYSAVVGWKCEERKPGDIRFADDRMLLIGRFVPGRTIGSEPGITPIIYVNDLDRAVTYATEHGGEIVKASVTEGDTRVARVRDPSGNLIGLWQFA